MIELAADEGAYQLQHGTHPEGRVDQVQVLQLLTKPAGQQSYQ